MIFRGVKDQPGSSVAAARDVAMTLLLSNVSYY